jgi:hypothetical protein
MSNTLDKFAPDLSDNSGNFNTVPLQMILYVC